MSSPEQPDVYRGPVRRVRIAVTGDRWRVVSEVHVDRMTIPLSPGPDRRTLRSGSFVVLTDDDDQVVHWQPIEDVADTSVEVFEPGGRIHREAGDLETLVEVIVPDDRPVGRLRVVTRGTEIDESDEEPEEGG